MSDDLQLPDAEGDRLVRSTFALLISNGAGAVLGVVFWAVAARLYRTSDVGNGVAAVSAMTLCANIGLLNLGTVFPRFLYPAGAKAGALLRRGYGASTGVALLAALCYLAITGHQGYIPSGWVAHLFFVEAVLLWVVFTIEDAALIGLRQPLVVPIENASFSVLKIALLPVFLVVAHAAGVFDAWVLPVAACVAGVNYYLFGTVLPRHVERSGRAGVLPGRRVFTRVVAAEYLGGLTFAALWNLPALFVYDVLGRKEAAYFQTPWIAATSFDLLLFSFATSLLVESSSRPTAATANVRRAVRLALVIMGPAMVVLVLGAPYFLAILGRHYAEQGTWLLRYVALALPFMGVNVLYVTFARLARRARRVFLVQAATSGVILALVYVLLKPLGLTGVGVAYLGGQALICLVLLPSVVRQYRRGDMTPGFSPDAPLVALDGAARADVALAGFEVGDGDGPLVDPPPAPPELPSAV